MKKTVFLALLAFMASSMLAQQGFNCSSHDKYQRQMESDPVFRQNQLQLEEETRQLLNNPSAARSSAATYVIPVVFHVIYTTPAGNISNAQIIDQMAILNQEFSRLQPDTALTPWAFKSLAAPFSVEFRLATIDPNGNCTNGINRVYSSLSNCSFDEDEVKSLSYWPSNKYLNIWLVQSMHYSGSMTCDGGGYATFPGGNPLLDGVNIRGDLIGSIGTAASNPLWGNFLGRYLIHELGHWFNLRHIWGDAVCGNDFVSDTPPAQASNSGCPSFPHNPMNTCGSNANGEMFTNYMDYTNGPCLNMFTTGQVARMTTAITSNASGRNNLWSNTNLIATGVSSPYTYPVACPSSPAILPNGVVVVCQGDSASFVDNSYGGQSSSRTWSFPGGSPSSVTDSIVKVQYNTVGVYTVALTQNYQSSSKTETFINKVQVIDNVPNTNYYMPFNDSFENQSLFDADWIILNQDNDATKWEWVNSTAYFGSSCVGIMNYGKAAPQLDELISPAYDLSTVASPTLTFRLHFAKRITANYDKLVVYISKNCGKTWQQLYVRTASSNLNTIPGNVPGSNIPNFQSDNDWRLEKINIVNSWANSVVRFKFSFTSGGGNNIFIDDINIDGLITTELEKRQISPLVQMFPNPAKDKLYIQTRSQAKGTFELQISDVLGKNCLSHTFVNEGGTKLDLDISSLKAGVYMISVTEPGGKCYNKKFIKQDPE